MVVLYGGCALSAREGSVFTFDREFLALIYAVKLNDVIYSIGQSKLLLIINH